MRHDEHNTSMHKADEDNIKVIHNENDHDGKGERHFFRRQTTI